MSESETITLAKSILSGMPVRPEVMRDVAKKLQHERAFNYARRILAKARVLPEVINNPSLRLKLAQQQALCTYKDLELPADTKFDAALKILQDVEDLRTTKDQETLGLVGAIYKRKWEVDGHKSNLERSLHYYLKGHKQGVAADQGYTSINAAYVLDLLAEQEAGEDEELNLGSNRMLQRREEARRIREDIVKTLPPLVEEPGHEWLGSQWWFLVTIAEAHFGLEQYSQAASWLRCATALPNVPEWEYEATARQLATIARLHAESTGSTGDLIGSPAWQGLREFLGGRAAGVRTAFVGKVGLALSGGGIRASLYHLGVLAKLADLDMLRHVEVLSCVSGGSIIGVHYYLEVRKLLQTKADAEITSDDYLNLVRRVEADFMRGVQKNIRMRVAASLAHTLKMIFDPYYSRTVRVGELFEKYIYDLVDDGGANRPRYMSDLLIHPVGEHTGFEPKSQNWRRQAKVPMLILNAATLNTGHNWQFTAVSMGESPVGLDSEIGGNSRLRRMYYHEAPKEYRKVRVGQAVAASACLPGVFEPVALPRLYPDMTVRLVDGGVRDNQGIAALMEQDCSVLLVSDASGQTQTMQNPAGGILDVLTRSNHILMKRVREAQFGVLDARRRAALLRGLMIVHPRKELNEGAVNWNDCPDMPLEEVAAPPPPTPFGMSREVQGLLASVRTDLDAFSEAEAFALMTSGYRMTEYELTGRVERRPGHRQPWRFLAVEGLMREGARAEPSARAFVELLKVSRYRWRKSLWLSPQLQRLVMVGRAAVFLLAVIVVVLAVSLLWLPAGTAQSVRGWLGAAVRSGEQLAVLATYLRAVFPVLAVLLIGLAVALWRNRRAGRALVEVLINCLLLLGWPLVWLHLLVFNRMYLDKGRVERFLPKKPAARSAAGEPRPQAKPAG